MMGRGSATKIQHSIAGSTDLGPVKLLIGQIAESSESFAAPHWNLPAGDLASELAVESSERMRFSLVQLEKFSPEQKWRFPTLNCH